MRNLKEMATVTKPAENIEPGDILVGDSGGFSEVYDVEPSSSLPGMYAVETEHGFLYLDADPSQEYPVLDEASIKTYYTD